MTLPCFCCGGQLASAVPPEHDDRNQPSEGTAFTTAGHYGSGAFDPMDGSMLELNVCDGCLTANPSRVRLLRMARPVEATASPWLPDPEDELEFVRLVPVDEAEDEW